MIRVDRNRVSKPVALASPRAARLRREAKKFFELPAAERAQRRYRFEPVHAEEDVRKAVGELFFAKCAFCESLTEADVTPGHYRPPDGALELDGTFLPDHYWWLAYEWANLYLVCPVCSAMKGNRFPITGRRATSDAGNAEFLAEAPLLLDPCDDNPQSHLAYSEQGEVVSDTERGRTTIALLALNRESLVQARRATYEELTESWLELRDRLTTRAADAEAAALAELANDPLPYAGLRRQFLHQWLRGLPGPVREIGRKPRLQVFFSRLADQKAATSTSARKELVRDFQVFWKDLETYSLDDESDKQKYYLHRRAIDRIEIRNFKAIDKLTVSFPEPGDGRTPWLMLLGENATGKSSVLQAVALALMGERYRARLDLDASSFVRHRCKNGHIRVFLTGSPEPIELAFSRHSKQFVGRSPESKLLLLGYGATRLLPRTSRSMPSGGEDVWVDNLFDPFVPLNDAASWIGALPRNSFPDVARAIKELLSLREQDVLERKRGRVAMRMFDTTVPLEQLSDGFQTVLALAADIMAVMMRKWRSMRVAEGIVLLDEIGSHLHPRWKMRIVTSLRAVFPKVQFIATTHNPLCLRGMNDSEVVVMHRYGENRIGAVTDLPGVRGLRVDQLLTSEHFGLSSTIDPEIEELFQEYYRLLALPKSSRTQQRRIEELRDRLQKFDVMGSTRRERMMLEAVDDYLAVEPDLLDLDNRRKLRAETRRKVTELWAQLGEQSRGWTDLLQ